MEMDDDAKHVLKPNGYMATWNPPNMVCIVSAAIWRAMVNQHVQVNNPPDGHEEMSIYDVIITIYMRKHYPEEVIHEHPDG